MRHFLYNTRMLTVGIISDTHGTLSSDAYAALADCDVIIHAGDIGKPSILRELETLAPVYAVLGNNDYDEYGSDVGKYARPILEGKRFLVSHYPRDVRLGVGGTGAVAPGDPLPHICIHGHTHLPKLQVGKDASPAELVMCPGSASRPRSGDPRTIGRIEIENGRILRASVESFTGKAILEWTS